MLVRIPQPPPRPSRICLSQKLQSLEGENKFQMHQNAQSKTYSILIMTTFSIKKNMYFQALKLQVDSLRSSLFSFIFFSWLFLNDLNVQLLLNKTNPWADDLLKFQSQPLRDEGKGESKTNFIVKQFIYQLINISELVSSQTVSGSQFTIIIVEGLQQFVDSRRLDCESNVNNSKSAEVLKVSFTQVEHHDVISYSHLKHFKEEAKKFCWLLGTSIESTDALQRQRLVDESFRVQGEAFLFPVARVEDSVAGCLVDYLGAIFSLAHRFYYKSISRQEQLSKVINDYVDRSVRLYLMQGKSIKPLRLSASIILPFGDNPGESSKILMLLRKPHMSFENSLVFPGGACDKEDETFTNHFPTFAKISAVRQLLEQTGILLLPSTCKLENISQLRDQYANRKFHNLNPLIINLWQKHLDNLIPIARFITPQFPKMSRFDCIFFLPLKGLQRINLGTSGNLNQLSIHIEESSKYLWATPQQYLKMRIAGKIFLPPPQNIILNYLARVGENAFKIRLKIEPFIGQFIQEGIFSLPGDKEYDYERLAPLQPKSRTSEEVHIYIQQKKLAHKQNHLFRVENILPVMKKDSALKDLQILVYPPEQNRTILSYLTQTLQAKL